MSDILKSFLLLSSLLLWGCSVISKDSPQKPIFESPQNYVGFVPEICGYLVFSSQGHNFYPNKKLERESEFGLGVKANKLFAKKIMNSNEQYVCLKGEIFNRGCGVDVICTDSIHEFAIKVDGLFRY